MKRFSYLLTASLCFLTLPHLIPAQTHYTVAAGNWSTPSVWNGGVVPGPTSDSILIHYSLVHAGTLDLDVGYMKVDSGVHLWSSTWSPTDSVIVNASEIEVMGAIETGYVNLNATSPIRVGVNAVVSSSRSMYLSAFNEEKYGLVWSGDTLVIGGSSTVNHHGELWVERYLTWSGNLHLRHHAYLDSYFGMIETGDTLQLDSNCTAIMENFTLGTYCTGKPTAQICVANEYIFTGTMEGGLDICDNSPGGPGDVNTGTYGWGVSHCSHGACYPVSIKDETTFTLEIFPNPVTESLTLRSSGPLTGNLALITPTGEIVFESDLHHQSECRYELPQLASGIYILRVSMGQGTKWLRVVVQ